MKKILLGTLGLSLFAMNLNAWEIVCFGQKTVYSSLPETEYYFNRDSDDLTMKGVWRVADGSSQFASERCKEQSDVRMESRTYKCGERVLVLDMLNGFGRMSYKDAVQELQCRDHSNLLNNSEF